MALERFEGTIDGLRGTVVLQQYGSMNDGLTLYYEFVPGSGSDGLTGITGTIDLTVTEGDHRVHVHYALNCRSRGGVYLDTFGVYEPVRGCWKRLGCSCPGVSR